MLYIQPVDDFSNTNALVELVYTGFDIPELLKWPELNMFNVRTFTVFTKYPDGPSRAYRPVNEFFETLNVEEQHEVAASLISMHCELMLGKDDASDINDVADKIGTLIDDLDIKLNLCDRLVAFVEASGIPISDMKDAGTRAQDTKSMTFMRDKAVIVMSIAVLMKLLSPVTGAFIAKYTHVVDNKFKEIHTQTIMTKLFDRKYHDLIVKLSMYITRIIKTKIKMSPTSIFNGSTLESTARHTIDMILVKKFVGVNLYKEDDEGNIIKYVASCSGSNVDSAAKNANASVNVKIIQDPVEIDQDEGNQSRLETESRQSAKTADYPILIKIAALNQCNRVVQDENIDQDLVKATYAYYALHPIEINPITEYAVATFYGPAIGGGCGIELLKSPVIGKLAALLQILCVQRDAPLLGHAITAACPVTERATEVSDYVFMNQWKSSSEYVECKRLLPPGFGEHEWDGKLKSIAVFLTTKSIMYNTAPAVWDLCEEQHKNGKPITDCLNVMLQLMQYLKVLYKKRSFSS